MRICLEDLNFLKQLTRDVIRDSTVRSGAIVDGNQSWFPFPVIKPGGGNCYPAFWIRDFVMSVDSGLIDVTTQINGLLLIAHSQQDTLLELPENARVPRGFIPDHIRFDGAPLFYPGCFDIATQGGKFGKLPALDDNSFFIHLAHRLIVKENNPHFARFLIHGKSLYQRLGEALVSLPRRPDSDSELVFTDESNWGVSFGFTDTVHMTGNLLMASLLKFSAATQMAEIAALIHADPQPFLQVREWLKKEIGPAFLTSIGLLKAATVLSGQPDVWGTALAVCIGALDDETARIAAQTLAKLYDEGKIACHGAIRHIPIGFGESEAWESLIIDVPFNTYQNGAYWSTPTGFVAAAIDTVNPELAEKLVGELIADLKEHDYRHGNSGVPFECFHFETSHAQNPIYLTSVSCPLGVLRRYE